MFQVVLKEDYEQGADPYITLTALGIYTELMMECEFGMSKKKSPFDYVKNINTKSEYDYDLSGMFRS